MDRENRERRSALLARLSALNEAHDAEANLTLTASERRRREREHRDTSAEILGEIEQLNSLPCYEGVPSTRDVENRMHGQPVDHRTLREGEPLNRETRMLDWAREHNEIPREHTEENMSLGRYFRGAILGDWRGADLERRTMQESTLTAGGYLVPAVLSAQLVDLARNRSRVLQAGATVFPMANSVVDVAKWTGDPVAAFHSESAVITPSDATLGRMRLTARTLPCIVKFSRELFEDTTINLDVKLAEVISVAIGNTIDVAALYGSGVAPQPLGLKLTSGVGTASMGANGLAPANFQWLINAIYAVAAANETPNGIIWNERTAKELASLVDTTNQYLMPPPYVSSLAKYSTNNVPINLVVGSGTTCSDVFVGDWSQLYVGTRTQLQFKLLEERYSDTGDYALMAWWRGDIGVARPGAFFVQTGLL